MVSKTLDFKSGLVLEYCMFSCQILRLSDCREVLNIMLQALYSPLFMQFILTPEAEALCRLVLQCILLTSASSWQTADLDKLVQIRLQEISCNLIWKQQHHSVNKGSGRKEHVVHRSVILN